MRRISPVTQVLVLAFCLFSSLLFEHTADAALTLAADGESSYCILHASDAPSSVKLAARELRQYIEKATGARIPVLDKEESADCLVISLGMTALLERNGLTAQDIPLEGYRIAVRGQDLFIVGPDTADGKFTEQGGTSNGTLNGVYSFLEDYVGVRWPMPGPLGEVVPKSDRLDVPQVDRIEGPGFLNRRIPYIQNERPEVQEWLRRQKQGYSLRLNHGHNFRQTIPRELYDKHPDWFPMIGGKRPPPAGRYKLETTNPDLVRAFAERAVAKLKAHPERYSYSISPSDSGGWSESPQARALYDRDPNGELSVTPLVLDFYNNVAAAVDDALPGGTVCGYIYSNYLYPPSGGVPPLQSNLCLVVAASISYGYGLYRPGTRRDWLAILEAWTQATSNIAYYDLPASFIQDVGAPNPPGLEILKFLYPRVAEHGMKGVYVYGVSNWAQGAITNYLLAKLNWDPQADVDALARDFFLAAYGQDAGPVMAKLYSTLDAATKRYHLANRKARYTLTPEVLKGLFVPVLPILANLYTRAAAVNSDPQVKIRLVKFADSLRVFTWYLRQQGLIADGFNSPFYASGETVEAIISAANEDHWQDFGSRSIVSGGRKTEQVSVGVIPPLPLAKSVRPFRLRGPARILLYSESDSNVGVELPLVRDFGEFARYALSDEEGSAITAGVLGKNTVIEFAAKAGNSYFLDIFANKAIYRLKVDGARYALKTDVTRDGLHLQNNVTPLYFYVPPNTDKLTVTLSSQSPRETAAAVLVAPGRSLAGRADTTESPAVEIVADGRTNAGEFWVLEWVPPRGGNVDDVWVGLSENLPQWVSIDPHAAIMVLPAEGVGALR